MRKLVPAGLPLLLTLSLGACAASGENAAAEEGWRPLFDGTTLTGWTNPYDWGTATA